MVLDNILTLNNDTHLTPSSIFEFDSCQWLGAQGFYYWQKFLTPIINVMADPKIPIDQFYQSLEIVNLNNVLIGKGRSSSKYYDFHKSNKDSKTICDFYLVIWFNSGGLTGTYNHQPIKIEKGDICMFDFSHAMSLHIHSSQYTCLLVPKIELQAHLPLHKTLSSRVLPNSSIETRMLAHLLDGLWPALETLEPEQGNALQRMLLSNLIGIFATPELSQPIDAQTTHTLESVCNYIEEHLTEELDTTSLCHDLGLSRSVLQRMFSPLGGVAFYIRDVRLHHALEYLISPDRPFKNITDVSAYWGFSSHSHFCRLFKKKYGITPRQAVQYQAPIESNNHVHSTN